MIWIPIAFLCTQLGCTIQAGQTEYSATNCFNTLAVARQLLEAEPTILAFHLECVAVNPT